MSDTGTSIYKSDNWSDDIRPKIHTLVSKIFTNTSKVLLAHAKFGFSDIAQLADPSIERTLFLLNIAGSALDNLERLSDLSYDETRVVLNAQQQILNVHNVANALKLGSKQDYLDAIERLYKQVDF